VCVGEAVAIGIAGCYSISGEVGDCPADRNSGGVPLSDWMPQGAVMVLLSLHVLAFGFTEACHHSLSHL
jgi:hypothetical protein